MKPKTTEWSRLGISEFANHEEWGLLIKIPLVNLKHEKGYEYNAFGIEEGAILWIEDSELVEPVLPNFQYQSVVLL